MNKLKQKILAFIYVFKNSLVSPKYYSQVVQQKLRFSLKYYFLLAFVASIIIGAVSFWTIVPQAKTAMYGFIKQGVALYPAELVVSIKEGKLSINQPVPYIIATPKEFIKGEENFPKNIIVFDTAGTLDDLKKYDTVFLVNEVNVLANDASNGKIQTFPLKEFPDGEVSQKVVTDLAAKLTPYISVVAYGMFAILFVFVFINNLIFKFVDFVIVGLILSLVGKIRGVSLHFRQYLQVAMHAATLAFVLDVCFSVFKYSPPTDMWFLLATLIYGLVVVFGMGKNVSGSKEILEGEIVKGSA